MTFWKRTRSKYGAKRVEYDGYSFASGLEARVYQELKLLELAGEIEILQTQSHVKLVVSNDGKSETFIYIADFLIYEKFKGRQVWVEAKGLEMDTWKFKKKLWRVVGPGLLRIYKGNKRNVFIHEEVEGGSDGNSSRDQASEKES